MATESLKSTKPGDAEYKVRSIPMSSGDKTQAAMNGGKKSKGVTNDSLMKLGRGMAKAAANGKGY